MTEIALQDEGDAPVETKRHPLAKCPQCPFFTDDFAYVGSVGPDKADIAFVGQNPGSAEIRTGRPFMGPSGRLLDKVLEHYHIDRKEVLIANACACTHKNNNNIKPSPAAIQACRPRLMQELKDRGVKKIVSLGNVPSQSILRTKTVISNLRVGPYRENQSELPGVKIIPTFHPAACLRSSASFPSMVNDIGKLVVEPPAWEEPYYTVWDTEKGALQALKVLKRKYKRFTVDIETDLDKEKTFDHPNKYKLLCIGMAWSRNRSIVFGQKACRYKSVRLAIADLLGQDDAELIFQNGKFDTAGLYAKGIRNLRLWHDTMYESYVLDERTGIHGLKYQGVEKLGCPRWDEEIDKYLGKGKQKRYGTIPKPILYKYNAYDTAATYGLDEYNMALIEADNYREPIRPRADGEQWGLARLHEFICLAAEGFMLTEYNGFAVDLPYNKELQKEYRAEIERLERTLASIVGPLNPRSPMQVKDALHELGVSIPKKRNAKGELAETTDAEALHMMLDREKKRPSNPKQLRAFIQDKKGKNVLGPEVAVVVKDPAVQFLGAMLEHRKVSKLDGTYVSGLQKYVDNGRVYIGAIQLHSTTTGRLSQRKPSLQVIPRGDKLRRQYKVSNPDHVLIESDYKQLELRVLTWLAQEPYFQEIFSDPSRDLFSELEPVIKPERSSRSVTSKKDRRNVIKCFVYGLAYGREAQSIADELDMPVAIAQQMLRDFFKTIPNIVNFREQTKLQALSGQDLITPFGRRRRFWLITDQNKKDIQNEACVDLETEIFTERGWLRHDQVLIGDRTLAINPSTGLAEWDTVRAVEHLSPRKVLILDPAKGTTSIAATPDHKWLVDNRDHPGQLRWTTTERFVQPDRIIRAVPHNSLPSTAKYTDAFVELIAWLWTEASKPDRNSAAFHIWQSYIANPENVVRIRTALQSLCPEPVKGSAYWTETPWPAKDKILDGRLIKKHSIAQFYIGTVLGKELHQVLSAHKIVKPAFVQELTQEQLQLFVETSWRGDGTYFTRPELGTGRANPCLGQAYEEQLFAVQLAMILLGIPTSTRKQLLKNGKTRYELYKLAGSYTAPRGGSGRVSSWTSDTRPVWCVQTSNANWLARRKGKVYYTGNCAFYPQSIGSDICVQAFTWLRPKLKGLAWCRNTIHDALYWETHQDNLELVAGIIRETMEASARAVCGDYVPLPVDIEVGRNWGDMISLEKWLDGERPYPCAVEPYYGGEPHLPMPASQ
jgi:uracil-DNA glycosylase family 4